MVVKISSSINLKWKKQPCECKGCNNGCCITVNKHACIDRHRPLRYHYGFLSVRIDRYSLYDLCWLIMHLDVIWVAFYTNFLPLSLLLLSTCLRFLDLVIWGLKLEDSCLILGSMVVVLIG